MKKKTSILLVFVGALLILLGFVVILVIDNPKEKDKPEKKESDSKCISALSNKDYSLKKMLIDDVNIEFNFLNCEMKETTEDKKYFISSPKNTFSIESYLSNYSAGSTAFEIYDTYISMEKYSSKIVKMESYSSVDNVLYRIVSAVPSEEVYDNKDFYSEYVIVYEVDADRTVVLKVKATSEENLDELFKTVLDTFKIVK